MPAQIKKRNFKNWKMAVLLFIGFIILILCYYQLLYKSERVEGGMTKAGVVFRAHTAQLRGVRFFPDGKYVASSSVDSTVRIWRKEDGAVVRILKHPAGVTSLDISKDGSLIVTGSYDFIVRLWRVADGVLLKAFEGHNETAWSVAFNPDGKTLASSGENASVNLWDISSGKIITSLPGHKRTVWSVKFSPDGSRIATASYDASVKIWSAADGRLLKTIEGHTEAVVDIAFSHDGKTLASTSDDKTIKLWNMPDGGLIRTLKVAEHVQAAAFSPDDSHLLTAGRDRPMMGEFLQEIFGDSKFNKGVSMRLWDVRSGRLLQTFADFANDVNDVAYSNDGLWIAGASEDKSVRLYRIIK